MITDRQAQRIADQWHNGQESALYALSSSGAIPNIELIRYEIDIELRDGTDEDRSALEELAEYVNAHGPRPAVPGWYEHVIKESAR